MKNTFDHLVWLGTGSATEPADLLNQAKNALLIDAREIVNQRLSNLKSQYPQTQIKVQTILVSADGKDTDFIEYNLPEYSATSAPTGIKSLLPGLKASSQEKRQTSSLVDIINSLSLKDDNNLLVLDIPDLSLPLLETLTQSSLTDQFKKLYVQASKSSLYNGSATEEELVTWLQDQGYSINGIGDSDPDMPWITATINPLWKQLQASKRESSTLSQELANIRKQAADQQEKLAMLNIEQQRLQDESKIQANQILTLKDQVDEKNKKLIDQENLISKLKLENESSKKSIEKNLIDQEKLIAGLKSESEELKKNMAKTIDREKDLSSQLNEQKYRNSNMEHEVIKLEAQVELITNVLLREKAF